MKKTGVFFLLCIVILSVGSLPAARAQKPDADQDQPVALQATETTTDSTPPAYLDDRSTAESLMMSFVNALNRQEYVRAYSYWEPGAEQLAKFDVFQQGYANTKSVQLTIGQVTSDAGAGQWHYNVPVEMVVQTTIGTTQTFVGCYLLHIANPGFQAEPPFGPLGISAAQVQQAASSANVADLMSKACPPGEPEPTEETPATVEPNAVDSSLYIDNRTGPTDVLRSMMNAINRHEYVRAYSYWDETAVTSKAVPAYDQFEKGYETTDTVQLTTGLVMSDVGAGQLYYSVPATLVAQSTDGKTSTFVGCYRLHLSQPAIQGVPPFRPLGIVSGQVKQVPNGTDTKPLMEQVCAGS